MGETKSDMDVEIEQKDRKQFLEDKIVIPDFKDIGEMNRLDSKTYHVKKKNDRTMNRLKKTPTNHKYIKI